MELLIRDFNGADAYFAEGGAHEWADLQEVLNGLIPHFQASDQSGIVGRPIFDPKGTNAALNAGAREKEWRVVPVPQELTMFGNDWDAGKGSTLAEWQFSNYPFLWNNVIRTQAVVTGNVRLVGVGTTEALVVVTKSGLFPASQSTLYFEQGNAQLDAVFKTGAFDLPVRLVGLTIPQDAREIEVVWSEYGGRYGRHPVKPRELVRMEIAWGRPTQYGQRRALFTRV